MADAGPCGSCNTQLSIVNRLSDNESLFCQGAAPRDHGRLKSTGYEHASLANIQRSNWHVDHTDA